MKSAIAITQEIDDLELASKELASQIKEKLNPCSKSIGIAYCDADVDVAKFGELMHAELDIDIVGTTTTATVERNTGYSDTGITLCVLTSEDVSLSIGYADDLNNDNYAESIRNAYNDVCGNIQEKPGLILAFAPYIADLTSENYVEVLDESSGGTPVFGGIATDHWELQHQKVFFNGKAFSRGLVFVLLRGNIKPVFAMRHSFGGGVERKGKITESSGNLIHKVGEQTFKEYLAEIVPVPDEDLVIYHFQSTPFVVELPDYDHNEQPVVRALCTIDHKTGAGGFLSKMPEGSLIHMNVIQKENLIESCSGAMEDIVKEMTADTNYEYSIIFISTCNARHILMSGTHDLESNIINEMLKSCPSELNAVGYYGFGEICPTTSDNKTINRFHNISFAVCAI